MTSYAEMRLQDFSELIASDQPVPGGGTVSAWAAATAVSLIQMVYGLTIDRKCFEPLPEALQATFRTRAATLTQIRDDFFTLMDSDSQAYMKVVHAFRLPKTNDAEKAIRRQSIQDAYYESATIPLAIARQAIALYPAILLAVEYGNPNAISDAGVSALLTHTAVEGAVMNVRINTCALKDEQIAVTIEAEADALLMESTAQKEHISATVFQKMAALS